MNTLLLPETRRRHHHSPEFKVQVIAACLQPGVPIAAIALANQLNANLVRRWVREHERRQIASIEPRVVGEEKVSTSLVPPPASFVPAEVPPPVVNSEPIRPVFR
ncbi:transposase [Crenobacter sp. SG2305]|uniref:transposase n=1 Tax=Crenobacter oryzisoli TaxID=3056844 RepID=UPI0025AAB3B1|nr:transposase [Crenobacter sp. SG2305]MDN0084646.1 transposase [Crenobacter sp. SG2305]